MGLIRLDCPHCPTDRVACKVVWEVSQGAGEYLCTAQCGACHMPITMKMLGYGPNAHAYTPGKYPGEMSGIFSVEKQWPTRPPVGAPPHTPEAVNRRFIEGDQAFQRESWNAAVAMYRSALDIATKALDGVPKGLSFFKRLEWLHDNHRITPDMKDWADHVRVEGNEALHDPEDFTEEDAKPLRLFTEMFLRYIYELPGEVAAFRGETPQA